MLNIGYGALQERSEGVRQQKNGKTCEIPKSETYNHILRGVVSLDFKAKHWNPKQVPMIWRQSIALIFQHLIAL